MQLNIKKLINKKNLLKKKSYAEDAIFLDQIENNCFFYRICTIFKEAYKNDL